MTSTVLGGYGFIGRSLASALQENGEECWLPKRGDTSIFNKPLGTVYYCIGLTADFRERPFETVDAHVCVLKKIIEKSDFDQLIYMSSTRIYGVSDNTDELEPVKLASYKTDDIYNISKIMGESLALSSGRSCRVARLSNVLGPNMGADNFIGMLLEDARKYKKVHFLTSMESQKDYIWIEDVVKILIALAKNGKESIYNIAGGENLSNKTIANFLLERGVEVTFSNDAPSVFSSPISNKRMVKDLGIIPCPIESKLSELMDRVLVP